MAKKTPWVPMDASNKPDERRTLCTFCSASMVLRYNTGRGFMSLQEPPNGATINVTGYGPFDISSVNNTDTVRTLHITQDDPDMRPISGGMALRLDFAGRSEKAYFCTWECVLKGIGIWAQNLIAKEVSKVLAV